MTKLMDLFSLEALQENIDGGFIRAQTHSEFPQLTILNYTELTQFSRHWNVVTKMCRGLIYNTETMEVLARPFPKIHNWDEPSAPRITEDAPLFSWSNKEDGSLGIAYRQPDGELAIATRGSFTSEQAIHATELLRKHPERYMFVNKDLERGSTTLFEIVYPDNRIVLDYGGMDALLHLGSVSIEHGYYEPNMVIAASETRTFYDLLQDLSRKNKEGWVAWLSPYKAVKIKQADYVELHRIVTGLNRKSVWRALKDNTVDQLLDQVPDELYDWVEEVRAELQDVFDKLLAEATKWMEKCGGFEGTQKDFALAIQRDAPPLVRGWAFGLRAGKNVDESIWRAIEPRGDER